jgi:RNA-directed DNA polymerase
MVMTKDRYLAALNLGLVQRQAGVDPEVAELVVSYGRMLVDSGEPLTFDVDPFLPGSREERLLSALRENSPGIDPRFLNFLAAWSGRMERQNRIAIFNRADLARQLGMTLAELKVVIGRRASFYRRTSIPKRNGNFRIIHSPRAPLRPVQNWILRSVLCGFEPPDAAHGFTTGRSIVTNAANHQGRRIVLTVDIADFFPSVKYTIVRRGFQQLGYPYSVAVDLANLCTLKGALPQGAPTSPALSNMACVRLDKRLTGLAASLGHNYSRYADDLTFSSNDQRLPSILPFLREILAEEGFKLREDKTRISRAGQRQLVNGIVVNEAATLPRRHIRILRAALHRLQAQGRDAVHVASSRPGSRDSIKVLDGHLAFLKMINPNRFQTLRANYIGSTSGPDIPAIIDKFGPSARADSE